MLDPNTGERIWAFDQVFDADDAEVENSMRLWWNTRMAGGDSSNRYKLNKLRPRFFMNFVFYTLAGSYADFRVKQVQSITKEKKVQEKMKKSIEKRRKTAYR